MHIPKKHSMSRKRVPEPHQLLMYSSETRAPRRAPLGTNGASPPNANAAATAKDKVGEFSPEEVANHRKALAEFRERCQDASTWKCTQSILYVNDGPRIIEKYALWLFPSDNERFLVSSSSSSSSPSPNDQDTPVHEFYILVRLEGRDKIDKISLGVCKDQHGRFTEAQQAITDVDPTEGHVLRIVSIEHDNQDLKGPDEASPHLNQAKHVREVIRKHAGKCDANANARPIFTVLRTQAYLDAKALLDNDYTDPDQWTQALAELEASRSNPWHLVNRVAELGAINKLKDAKTSTTGNVHIVDDIWLVSETTPTSSSEILVAARWAVLKSINGTGSIPRSKLWEPVVVSRGNDEVFQLMRMA